MSLLLERTKFKFSLSPTPLAYDPIFQWIKTKLYRREKRGQEFSGELPGTLITKGSMQLKSLVDPESLGSDGSPFCWEPASLSLGDRGCSSRSLCWVWMVQEIWPWNEEVATLGWTSRVFKVPGVKQGEWSHSLCLPVLFDRGVWRTERPLQLWAQQAGPGPGGSHSCLRWEGHTLPTARLSEWCPAPSLTPSIIM